MDNEFEEFQDYEDEQEINTINYKIKSNKEYIINRNDHNGKAFYNIVVSKKNKDDTVVYGTKIVRFRNDVELQDKTKIIIKDAFEDFYKKDKYTTIFTLIITDFEIVSQPDDIVNQAYQEFNSNDDIETPF